MDDEEGRIADGGKGGAGIFPDEGAAAYVEESDEDWADDGIGGTGGIGGADGIGGAGGVAAGVRRTYGIAVWEADEAVGTFGIWVEGRDAEGLGLFWTTAGVGGIGVEACVFGYIGV